MTSKAIARIVPIKCEEFDPREPFYVFTVNDFGEGLKGKLMDGAPYSLPKRHWKVEMLPVEWDGEGLPPVGAIIEVESPRHGWVEATVTAVTDNWIVAKYSDGAEFAGCHRILKDGVFINHHTTFRPIRSARDKAVEAMTNWRNVPTRINETYYHAVYDAIAAGKIPGVKLDN